MKMQLDKKTGFTILAGIVVLVLILVSYAYFKSLPSPATSGTGSSPAAPVYAPQGQLVSGFPQGLILEGAAQVANSYAIKYSATGNQYTAEWSSSTSMAALYKKYQDYFNQNGWTLKNAVTAGTAMRAAYVTKGSAIVNLVVVPQGAGSKIDITYATQ